MRKPDFTDLVERYAPELYGYLWRMLADHHDAEDCLQEVFLRAFRAYERTESDSNFRAWLYKIATNRAYTMRKQRAKKRAKERGFDDLLLVSDENPAGIVSQRDQLERIAEEVDRLPGRQRAAILMRKYQDLSYDEIGSALACSTEAARANVYQGLKKLRQKLALSERSEVR